MSIPHKGGTRIHALGSFFGGFQFRSHLDHYFALVRTTGWASTVRQNRCLALRTLLGIHQLYIVLLASTITTMPGMSLLW